jgi:hypothetical protein
MLDRVYARATGLWWRRRFAPITAGAVVLCLAVGVPLLRAGGGDRPTKLATQPRDATSTVPEGASSGAVGDAATTSTTGPVAASPTTSRPNGSVSTVVPKPAPTTTSAPRSGTTPVDRCRNNNGDASCGDFRWASDPGANAPLGFTVTYSPQQPHAGEEVTFTVRVVDPDASPIHSCGDAYDDQPTFAAVGCAHTMECAANYGSWDVPAKQRGEATFTYKHAFVSAGDHTAEFHAESLQGSKSAGQCAAQPNPYASVGSQVVKVTVS